MGSSVASAAPHPAPRPPAAPPAAPPTLGRARGMALGRLVLEHPLDVCQPGCHAMPLATGLPGGLPVGAGTCPSPGRPSQGTACMACSPSHPSASAAPPLTPCLGEPRGCLLCVLLRVVPEERLPVGVRIHYDAQYTVDLSSVPAPASHASCTPARRPAEGPACATVSRGPGAGGSRAVCEEEASSWSPPCSVVPETGCL